MRFAFIKSLLVAASLSVLALPVWAEKVLGAALLFVHHQKNHQGVSA
ncbi:MAG: hypothetical protein R3E89_13340 [Thiolinea sp.]